MTLSYGEGLYGDAAGVVTPLDHRLAQIGPYTKTSTRNLIRAGLFYNGSTTVVSGTAGMSYDVAAFSAVSTRGATQGVVPFANDATVNVVTTAAPGSNSRYDVVYAWPRDFAIDGTDSDPVLGVENGTAAASPTVPSLAAYPGAIELARILVPAGVTATNSGTTITQTAPFTSVDGVPVPFRSTTEMDTWATALTSQRAYDLSSGVTYRWDGADWALIPYASMVAKRSATQSLATATPTLVQFDSTAYTQGDFTLSAGVFACVRAGTYVINASLQFSGSSGGNRYIDVERTASGGGSAVLLATDDTEASASTRWPSPKVLTVATFTAGQELRVTGTQTSGSSRSVTEGSTVHLERIA